MRPLMSLPNARVSFDFVPMNSDGLDVLAQPDDFALTVGHLDSDRRLAGHAFDENALGFEGEAQVVGEIGNAAVLDASFGLEFESRDYRPGIDLRHLPVDIKLRVLFGEHLGQQLQFVGINRLLLVGTVQQAAGRQFEATSRDAWHGRLWFRSGVGALRHFNIRNDGFRRMAWLRLDGVFLTSAGRGHAIDAGSSNRLWRIGRCWSRRGACWNQLSGDRRPSSAPLFQLLLHLLFRPVVLPVFVAVPERNYEGETGRRPDSQGGERESRREIKRYRQNRGAHDICAGRIQVMDEEVADDAPAKPSMGITPIQRT